MSRVHRGVDIMNVIPANRKSGRRHFATDRKLRSQGNNVTAPRA
jgi:hypothetical protein